MKVLLTGAGGFIGSYLAKCWEANESISVTGTSRAKPLNNLNVTLCDLAKELPFRDNYDIVVHTAARSPSSSTKVTDFIASNIEATRNLVEFALQAGVKKFIYLSSISIYGDVRVPLVDEETEVINPGIYGMTKFIGEMLIKDAGFKSSIALRLPGVLGPGAKTPWLCNITERFKKNLPVYYYNPEALFNNMVHVSDLEKFITNLFEYDLKGFDIMTLGAKECIPIKSLVEILKRRTESGSKLIQTGKEIKSFIISTKKAESIGFNPMCADKILDSLI